MMYFHNEPTPEQRESSIFVLDFTLDSMELKAGAADVRKSGRTVQMLVRTGEVEDRIYPTGQDLRHRWCKKAAGKAHMEHYNQVADIVTAAGSNRTGSSV